MEEEYHPWMKGFTIATLVVGIIAIFVAFSLFGDSSSVGGGFLLLIVAGLAIWGSSWILKISDGFKRWSRLSSMQKFVGILVMIVGCYIGIAFIVVLRAIGVGIRENR